MFGTQNFRSLGNEVRMAQGFGPMPGAGPATVTPDPAAAPPAPAVSPVSTPTAVVPPPAPAPAAGMTQGTQQVLIAGSIAAFAFIGTIFFSK